MRADPAVALTDGNPNWPALRLVLAPVDAGASPDTTIRGEIASGYRRWGLAVAHRLDGRLSWALDDPDRGTVVVVDRLGTRPLYYRLGAGIPKVAETPRACFDAGETPAPCWESLAAFLACEPPPRDSTYFENVHAVGAGEQVVLRAGGVQRSRYWSLRSVPRLSLSSDAEYVEALRDLLRRLVPEPVGSTPRGVGVALSAGLDSGLVAAFAREVGPVIPLRWSASGFPAADESADSAAVATALGLEPGEPIELADHPPLSGPANHDPNLPSWLPLAEAWVATCQRARRRGLEVVLTGTYGDMLWGGYISAYPDLIRERRFGELAGDIARSSRATGLDWFSVLREDLLAPMTPRFLRRSVRRRRFGEWIPWLSRRAQQALEAGGRPALPGEYGGREGRIRVLENPLLPWAMGEMDRLAWRHGVRLVHPLMDWRLAAFMAAVPQSLCFRGGVDKWIEREVVRGVLPSRVIERLGKVVLTDVARAALLGPSGERIGGWLRDMRLSDLGLVHERGLRSAFEELRQGGPWNSPLWHALQLESWLRRFYA